MANSLKEHIMEHGIFIPVLVEAGRLKPSDRFVYGLLRGYFTGQKYFQVDPRFRAELASALHLSAVTIKICLSRIREANFLKLVHRKNGDWFTFPKPTAKQKRMVREHIDRVNEAGRSCEMPQFGYPNEEDL